MVTLNPSLAPAEWLALDIETAGGRPEDADAWMRTNWSPSDKWKPETIGSRYLEMVVKKRERLALLDASQVIAVSLRTPSETGVIHSMQSHLIEREQPRGFTRRRRSRTG